MTTKPTPERVEAAVERAQTAQEKAADATAKAAELAAAQIEADQAMLVRAQAVAKPVTAAAQVTETITPGPSGEISITLSHPLSRDQARQAQINTDRDLREGESIAVGKDTARRIISSGYATVDPENRVAVQAILRSTGAEPSATFGN